MLKVWTTMTGVAIEAENLSCALGGRKVIANINLSVRDGETLGIIGPNGAGKSTLVRCLAGLLRFEGSIKVFGRDIRRMRRRELARVISYVPQAYFYYFPYSVFEFVLMARYPYVSRLAGFTKDDTDAATRALETVGIESLKDRSMGTLSGGELQKVFLAGALAQGARIAIMDEPTVFLDPKNQSELLNLVLKLASAEGRTLIVVSHDVNFVAQVADRIIGIKDGSLVFEGKSDALAPDVLKDIYDAEFVSVEHPHTKRPVALISPEKK